MQWPGSISFEAWQYLLNGLAVSPPFRGPSQAMIGEGPRKGVGMQKRSLLVTSTDP